MRDRFDQHAGKWNEMQDFLAGERTVRIRHWAALPKRG
jgi:hypothetical protein